MFSHLQWKDRLRIEKILKEKKSKKQFLTMTERTSRADLMFLMPDGTMASAAAVLEKMRSRYCTARWMGGLSSCA